MTGADCRPPSPAKLHNCCPLGTSTPTRVPLSRNTPRFPMNAGGLSELPWYGILTATPFGFYCNRTFVRIRSLFRPLSNVDYALVEEGLLFCPTTPEQVNAIFSQTTWPVNGFFFNRHFFSPEIA
jgi:hypothetical protein